MNIADYRYIAHRGIYNNDKGIVENSLHAFNKAVQEGIAIELDVRLTKDNTIVVFHDSELKRITGVEGKVIDLNLEELKELRLLNTDSKIPTLEEVLTLIDGKVPILIEIKNEDNVGVLENLLMESLKSYNGEYIIESFNIFSVIYIKERYKDIKVGQLLSGNYDTFKDIINKFLNVVKPDFIAYDINYLTEEQKRFCEENNMYLISWTIKNNEDLEKAKKLSDGIIVENIDKLDIKNKQAKV